MADSQQQLAQRKISTSSTTDQQPQRKTSVEKKSVSFDQSTSIDRQNSQISEHSEVFEPKTGSLDKEQTIEKPEDVST